MSLWGRTDWSQYVSAQVVIGNARIGELCNDTRWPGDNLRNLCRLYQSMGQAANVARRTESSVKVRCIQFRVNSILPQVVKKVGVRSETPKSDIPEVD